MSNVSDKGLIRLSRRIETVYSVSTLQETWHRQDGRREGRRGKRGGNLHHHQPSAADLNLHIPIAFLREMHFSSKLIKVAHEARQNEFAFTNPKTVVSLDISAF